MSLKLHQNFLLNAWMVAEIWPLDAVTDADALRKCLKILAVRYDEADGKHFAAVRIQTQIVDDRAKFQRRLHLAQRHILASLQLHQIFLAIYQHCQHDNTMYASIHLAIIAVSYTQHEQ